LRNYLVHSSDVLHGEHIGVDGFRIWADRDILLKDIDWPKAKKELLERQEKQIDLLSVATKSLPVINEVHEQFLDYLIDEQIKQDIEYLNEAAKKTILINSQTWYIFSFKGIENVKDPMIIGGVSGIGLDYWQLNWMGYAFLRKYIQDKGL